MYAVGGGGHAIQVINIIHFFGASMWRFFSQLSRDIPMIAGVLAYTISDLQPDIDLATDGIN
jgi:hypothetical protein